MGGLKHVRHPARVAILLQKMSVLRVTLGQAFVAVGLRWLFASYVAEVQSIGIWPRGRVFSALRRCLV